MKQIVKCCLMAVALLCGSLNVANASEASKKSSAVKKEAKAKTKVSGKKSNKGLLKGYIDGETAGDSYGYEVHAKGGMTNVLEQVGLYVSEGENPMQTMRFQVNVYDMKDVKKSPATQFVSVLPQPIEFVFDSKDVKSGKYVYKLPKSITLPQDAMVEIVFLDNLGDKKLWFKNKLVEKDTWMKSGDKEWILQPFATPFFVEYEEAAGIKDEE